ncbi:hypoxia inducible factor 1 subunit alpha, like 2 isoform X2 [Oncorhynchus mykiss]|uniref:Hypoxia-inducible factor 1-alpha n=1 Tax=Oncorhynchus mykiss TaxID=8022 RepID=A0A8C7U324_ONCMY|nr:hypoxia inducible factor 1 subunit alpha, like 2 isoform X2 [Oncorhynchus mykiss]
MFPHLGNSLEDACDQKLHKTKRQKDRINGQKRSRVSTERLRAQSRVAAKSRRERERRLFGELAAWLPLPSGLTGHIDKASIVRLTLDYLRLRALLDHRDNVTPETRVCSDTVHFTMHGRYPMAGIFSVETVLESAVGGFMLLVSQNGQVIFTTGDIRTHTGINQMDLIGRSLFDFMHHCDQREVRDILSKMIATERQQQCDFLLRVKSTLTSQGRAVNQRHTRWKVIHCVGVKKQSHLPESACLVLMCRPLPISQCIIRDASLNHKTFLSGHHPDMRFTYCHSGVKELTGYTETELLGQSVYQYYHTSDCQHIHKAHQSLLSKGQATMGRYRLLLKGGGYVWAETDASVVYNNQTGQPQSVVCINYILSEVELPEMVFSLQQTEPLLRPCYSDLVGPILQNETYPAAETAVHLRNTKIPTPEHNNEIQTYEGYSELNREDQMNMNSLSELCELDLDSLAPYIPMDGEDFLLTPVLDGILAMIEGPVLPPGLEGHCSLGKSPISAGSFTTHQMKTLQIEPPCDSGASHTVKESEFGDHMKSVYRGGSAVFKEGPDYAGLEGLVPNEQWSEKHKSCRHPQALMAAAVRLPYRTVEYFPIHPQDGSTCLCGSPSSLPVLSKLDCEVTLGPTSCLLQGSEITSVLDQAPSRFLHMTTWGINQLSTQYAHPCYAPRSAIEVSSGTSTSYAEWIT